LKKVFLDNEIKDLITNAKEYIFPGIEIYINTEDKDIYLEHVASYRVNSNYSTNISDILHIDFLYPLGSFIKDIYRYKDALELTIILTVKKKKITKHYKCMLVNDLANKYDSKLTKINADKLDEQSMETISIQGVDPLFLALKNVTTSGCYHNLKLDKLIKGILGNSLDKITVLGRKLEYYFNFYTPINDREYLNILIKPYSKIIKLPYILQHSDYGLYDSDIGIYFSNIETIHNKTSYNIDIFPLNDIERYREDTKRPKLYLISSLTPNIDKNTFNAYLEVDTYKIIVNDIEFKDTTNKSRYDVGTGYIETFSDLNTNKELLTITNDKIVMDNESTTSTTITDDKTLDYARLLETDYDDNIFKFKSVLNSNKMILGIIKIPNINAEFIHPGMAVKYVYLKNDIVIEATGIVHGKDITYDFSKKISMTVLLINIIRT